MVWKLVALSVSNNMSMMDFAHISLIAVLPIWLIRDIKSPSIILRYDISCVAQSDHFGLCSVRIMGNSCHNSSSFISSSFFIRQKYLFSAEYQRYTSKPFTRKMQQSRISLPAKRWCGTRRRKATWRCANLRKNCITGRYHNRDCFHSSIITSRFNCAKRLMRLRSLEIVTIP